MLEWSYIATWAPQLFLRCLTPGGCSDACLACVGVFLQASTNITQQ